MGLIVLLSMGAFNLEANAKRSNEMIFIQKAANMYSSPGKNKVSGKAPASIYKQYGKSGKWSKIKNAKKKYVWVANAKALSTVKTTKYKGTENEIVRLVNVERKKRGIASLKSSTQLKNMAYLRNYDMVQERYFAHISPRYGRWANMLYSSEYEFKYAGENLAAGFTTARSFVKGWMDSPTHRANLLNPRFREIGVAVSPGNSRSYYQSYATQWFSD